MRIRRRPQSSSLSLLQSSDPSTSTAPQTPQNAAARSREWMRGGKEEEDGAAAGRRPLHHATVDLGKKSGVARRLALQQDNGVGCSNSKRPGAGAEQGAKDGTHRSLVNGHRCGLDEKESSPCTGGEVSKQPEPATEVAAGEPPVSNGAAAPVAPAVTVAAKEGKSVGNGNGGVAKKRRGGPAVLMEGSRCSRVNGRGWRCSQPTLVGYALCEHHLGKGRMRSVTGAAAAGGRGGASQLGRTEHTRLPTTTPTPRIPATAPPTSRAP
ncbi:uncharacterized protein LOC107304330 [Oryza brachyantha]|uniref:uncharacterized protein LOC107304330 n=1 Tax=Oryza brachyantha TaxID=4533 RepID=UPI0007762447|nr:uncharacterized protein LOC107304330 [Oryza brachyantha]